MCSQPGVNRSHPNTDSPDLLAAIAAGGGLEGGRAVIDLLPMGALVVAGVSAETARVIHANPAFTEIAGFTPETGATRAAMPYDFYLPDHRTLLACDELPCVQAIVSGETIHDVELHVRRPDGAWRVVLATASPVRSDRGPAGAIVLLHDITERRQRNDLARYLASFPEQNPNPVVEVDLAGRVTYANPAAMRLFPDLAGAGWGHPFLQGIEALAIGLQGNGPAPPEREVRCGDAVFFQAIHNIPERRVLRLYCLDITHHRRIEEDRDRLRRERETQRQLLESVVAHTPAGVAVLAGPDHRYALVSRAQVAMARGKGRLVGRTFAEVWPETRDHEAQRMLDRVYESGDAIHLEEAQMLLERGEGPEEAFFNLDTVPLRSEDGQVEGVILFSHEITDLVVGRRNAEILADTLDAANEQLQAQSEELRATNEELRASYEELQAQSEELQEQAGDLRSANSALYEGKQRLRSIIDNANAIVWLKDLDGRFLVVNAYSSRLLGLTQEEMIGRTLFDLFPQDVAAKYTAIDQQVLAAGTAMEFEEIVELPDGARSYAAVKFPLLDATGRAYAVGTLCTDISERKRMEQERETTVEFLRLVNESTSTALLVEAAVRFVQRQSGCEAVGIRLREGDDYPYYEAQGLPQEFVRLENDLCLRGPSGEPRRDPAGHPILECMCGNVISGRFDPSKPFFTARGSFWTNSTTQLLASTTEADRQARTRDRCNGEGYESVALVPLRVGDERMGLLQLNDRREGMFTPERIALWERLAGYLAVAVAKLRAEDALRDRESELRLIMDSAPALISYIGIDGCYRRVNRAYERWYARPAAEIQGLHMRELLGDATWQASRQYVERALAGEVVTFQGGSAAKRDGRCVEVTFTPDCDEAGRVRGLVAHVVDTTERRQAEEARARLAAILNATTDFVGTADARGRALSINPAGRRMLGIAETEEVAGVEIGRWHPAWAYDLVANEGIPAALRDGVWAGETALLTLDGREIPVHQLILTHKRPDGSVEFLSTVARDLRRQKQLEDELRQAQKMEAVGRLAGGVAHDFNNVLMPIMTYSQLLCDSLEPGTQAHRRAVAIAGAAERAADLPRQLLAFSRKQIIQPKVMDLNEALAGVERLLGQLIGEDILLTAVPGAGLGQVLADPGQIDQVLLNLVVNARDAMPDGGRLTIETRNVDLDDAHACRLVGVEPGRYVMLAVSDTGCGMDAETRSRIFEPFFTTKEQGKGTGLGLATVYGIVKQSNGEIRVYSEPGAGTSFRVYLPRVQPPDGNEGDAPQLGAPQKGSETILVVEDADAVREVAKEILAELGYTVIAAANGDDALAATRRHPGPIHLLLTDVVMPGMSGRQLADQLTLECPDTRVIFMSGYTEDAIVRHGVLEEGIAFLQKPFTPGILLRKVREILDRPAEP